MEIAKRGGYSLLAGDERVVRYVLMQLSPHSSTRNGYITALKALFDYLKAQGLRPDNPMVEIVRPAPMRPMPRPLDLDAARAYEAAAVRLGARYETIAVLGLYQGWRRDEMRLAQWSWFFQANGRAWADVTGKGGKTDRVPVHARLITALRRLRAEHTDPSWLFPSSYGPTQGQAVSQGWMRSAHLRICQEAGIEGRVTLHQLRHSYVTYLRRIAGADRAVVQRGARHTDPKSTEFYLEVLPDEVATFQDRLNYEAPGEKP